MALATISLYLNVSNSNKVGEAPIIIRITKDRKHKYKSTGIRILPKFWDERKGKIKPSHPHARQFNGVIDKLMNDIQNDITKEETVNPNISVNRIKENIATKVKNNDFFEVAEEMNRRYEADGKIGTLDLSRAVLNKFSKFLKTTSIQFGEITPRTLNKYQTYLLTELKNRINTAGKDLKYINRVFNYAIKVGIINDGQNPFKIFSYETEKTQRVFLTETELKSIEQVSVNERVNRTRDIILFQFYSGGLRISDILLLKWNQIDDGRIYVNIKKTNTQITHMLNENALTLLEKFYTDEARPNDYVFSMLPKNFDENSLRELDTNISRATAKINKDLKIIAWYSNIDKPLSTHIMRHTFATIALSKGIRTDVLQKVLGHSNIRETQIYAKMLNQTVDEEMKKFKL